MTEENVWSQNNPLGFFYAGGPGANLKMREKIALAQMMNKKAYPKTFGEGISSVGDSIYDAFMQKQLEAADITAQNAAVKGAPVDEAGATVAPVGAPRRTVSYASEGVTPLAEQPGIGGVSPAVPLPADQQQSYEPGAPVRLSSPEQLQDFRRQRDQEMGRARSVVPQPPPPLQQPPQALPAAAPPPLLPPSPPAQGFRDRFDAAFPGGGPQSAAPPADPRQAIALAMMPQGAAGGSPPNPMPMPEASPTGSGNPMDAMALASPPPGPVKAAPPAAPLRQAPQQVAEAQPQPVPGYVPPQRTDPTGAKIIQPSREELRLGAWMAANQGNPYVAGSPDAKRYNLLVQERERKQAEQSKLFEADIARTTKREEQRQQGLMDQEKRMLEAQETRQKLINYGQTRAPAGGVTPGRPDPRLGTDASPQRTGVPDPDPMPSTAIPVTWYEAQQKKVMEAGANLEAAKPELAETLDLIKQARAHPSKPWSLGFGGSLAQLTASGQGFAAINEQLKGKNLVAAYQKIKGTGPVGEREGENIAKAQARLGTAQSEADYDKAVNDLESSLRSAVERAERKMNRPVTAYQQNPDDPPAPDLGQRGEWKGKQVEYIGGDPSKDSSYRTLGR